MTFDVYFNEYYVYKKIGCVALGYELLLQTTRSGRTFHCNEFCGFGTVPVHIQSPPHSAPNQSAACDGSSVRSVLYLFLSGPIATHRSGTIQQRTCHVLTVARQRKIPQKSSNIAVEKNYLRRDIGAELQRKQRKSSGIHFFFKYQNKYSPNGIHSRKEHKVNEKIFV